jgi:hypothetical protein
MHGALLAMNKITKTIVFLLFVPLICILSCRKNSGPSWDTQILAPLIKTSLSVTNLITNANAVSNADSSVTLVFRDSLYSLSIDSLFKIRDTTLADIYPGIPGIPLSPGGSIIPGGGNPSQTTYNLGSVNLSKALVKSGFVTFKVISTLPRVTDYTYSVPSATNGTPLAISVQVPASTASVKRQERDTTISLSGYTVDFTGLNHNGYNTLITVLNGILDPAAAAYTLTSNDSVIITAQFYGMVPEYGQGYFGQTKKIIGPTKSNFPLFNGISAGSLNLKSASVNFTLENGFGVDARLYIDSLYSMNTRPGGNNVPLIGNIVHNAININRATATINPLSPVIPSVQTYSITNANSNIVQWIDNLPNAIDYKLELTTDPLGNVSGNQDFAYYGYGIKAYLDVSVPLFIATNNLTLQDTLSVNFASSSETKQVKSGTFTLYASNLFPFSAGMQIYMLNSNMQIADSILIPVQTIAAGIPNTNGMVTSPTNSILTIPLDANHTNTLFSSKKIVIKAVFNMGCSTCTPIKYSKIYNTYQLNLKLIGNFDYQVKG